MEDLINEIEEMIDEKAEQILTGSETYKDAVKTVRMSNLKLKHGDIGRVIAGKLLEIINNKSIEQSIVRK